MSDEGATVAKFTGAGWSAVTCDHCAAEWNARDPANAACPCCGCYQREKVERMRSLYLDSLKSVAVLALCVGGVAVVMALAFAQGFRRRRCPSACRER